MNKLAIRYIVYDKIRSILTIISISVSVMLVYLILALSESGLNSFLSEFLVFRPDQLVILPISFGVGGAGFFEDKDVNKVKGIPCIEKAYPYIQTVKTVNYKDRITSLSVGTGTNFLEDYTLYIEMEKGRVIENSDRKVVVFGYNVWKKFDEIKIGDLVYIENKSFKIVGLIKKSSIQNIDDLIHIPIQDMIEMTGKKYSTILAYYDLNCDYKELETNIKDSLKKGDRPVSVISAEFIRETLGNAYILFSSVSVILSTVASIVGSLGITNTIIASIAARYKQIATMKTLGANNKYILKLVFWQASILILAGIILAILISNLVLIFASNYIEIKYGLFNIILSILVIYLLSISIPLLFVYRRIKNISPIDALR